jgi:hypothetical protein
MKDYFWRWVIVFYSFVCSWIVDMLLHLDHLWVPLSRQVKLHWLTNWLHALDCRMEFKAPCCEFSESGLLCFNVISILLSAFQGFTGRHMRTQLFVQNLLKVRRVRVFQFVQETHISCSWIERKDCYETARVEALHLCPIDHGDLQFQAPTWCSLLVSVLMLSYLYLWSSIGVGIYRTYVILWAQNFW